jgi:nicotinamide riboside kinase
LTAPDFDFVQDGTREGEKIRLEMHQWLVATLDRQGKHYITVAGAHDRRLAESIAAIDSLLVFPMLDAN